MLVRTAAGGGQAGPLRIDLGGRYSGSCMRPYSEDEARQAFQRMEAQHRATGWAPAGDGGVFLPSPNSVILVAGATVGGLVGMSSHVAGRFQLKPGRNQQVSVETMSRATETMSSAAGNVCSCHHSSAPDLVG